MSEVKRKRKIDDEEIERAWQEESEIEDDDKKEEAEEDIDDVVSVEPSRSTSRASHSWASWRKIGNVKDTSLPELDSILDFTGKQCSWFPQFRTIWMLYQVFSFVYF